jgi:hypothetical protein
MVFSAYAISTETPNNPGADGGPLCDDPAAFFSAVHLLGLVVQTPESQGAVIGIYCDSG